LDNSGLDGTYDDSYDHDNTYGSNHSTVLEDEDEDLITDEVITGVDEDEDEDDYEDEDEDDFDIDVDL
jgi:DNA-directed RNA polymerase subunit beta'